MKKLLTLDDLYNFYSQKGETCTFNASESNSKIYVQIESSTSFSGDYDPDVFKTKVHLKACHLFKNRNGSSISEEAMKKAIPSIYNAPILGYIHQLSDGSYDFAGHEMEIKNGECEYKEVPVGTIPESCNAQLIFDEEKNKTYLEVDGLIYNEYSRAAQILQDKVEAKVSVEIAIDDLSYSAQEKTLIINEFHFMGVTILGVTNDELERPIQEGMEGSNITLKDFSVSTINSNKELANATKELNNSAQAFANNDTIGGAHKMDKLNELLAKYGKTIEELPFASEVEGMSFEELEAKFVESFEGQSTFVGGGQKEKKSKYSVTINDVTREFDLSLNDKICALAALVNDTYQDDDAWYCVTVFDNYLVMVDGWREIAYKQEYTESDGIFALSGERIQVYANWLTKEEMDKLDEMRNSYFDMIRKQHEKEINDVLNDEAYSDITDTEEFAELQKNAVNFSAEEVSLKADALLGKFCKQKKIIGKVGFSGTAKPSRKTPYGSLFK